MWVCWNHMTGGGRAVQGSGVRPGSRVRSAGGVVRAGGGPVLRAAGASAAGPGLSGWLVEWSGTQERLVAGGVRRGHHAGRDAAVVEPLALDRKSTRLNSSHRCISYAVF